MAANCSVAAGHLAGLGAAVRAVRCATRRADGVLRVSREFGCVPGQPRVHEGRGCLSLFLSSRFYEPKVSLWDLTVSRGSVSQWSE